jgi:hypothetical protein
MASKKVRAGIRSLQVTDKERGDTIAFDVGGTVEVELSGSVAETMESANNPAAGYKETASRGRLSSEVLDGGDVSLSRMMGWRDVTAICQCANGKTYSADGWLTDKPSLNVLDGTLTIAIEGIVTELTFG